jgi:uncharacterized protein (DUF433 family)
LAGTRIPIAAIKRLSEDGADAEAIIALYPDLTPRDIQAALAAEPDTRTRRAS